MTVRFLASPSSGIPAGRTSRAWSRRNRDFSYSTLVGTEEYTTIQTYFADDIGYTFQALSPFESECKNQHQEEPISVYNKRGKDKRSDPQEIVSDNDAATIMSGDVPQIEGKTRRFKRNARRQIAVAMERARNGWISLIYKLSDMRRHGRLVSTPPKCFS